jgi:soluble lytic murein transglycosylase-like protein
MTGVDIVLNRINSIEKNFNALENITMKPDESFQAILDASMSDKTSGTSASRQKIEALIDEYATKNSLDADFVKAVVKQESGYNPKATSHCGAMGLMQLMPLTAKGLGVENPYNAQENIEGGTKYLKGLMDRFGNNKELALAAYNAGPNAVKKYGGIPPYAETQNYVKSVMANYDSLKRY